jgi:hypothetical protein
MSAEGDIVQTEYGWAVASERPSMRRDMYWLKLPERHVYYWDGDGWYRVDGEKIDFIPDGELPHG